MKHPFIKNIKRYLPNAYSKCNALWTQVFKAYDEFHSKIKLANVGDGSNKELELGTHFLYTNAGLMKVSLVLHTFWMRKDKILSHIDFRKKCDITIDSVAYSGCQLAIKKFLHNSYFEFGNNSVMNVMACLQKLHEKIRVANFIMIY